jgi:DNA-binding MarR family transcriptional regulator
MSTETPPVAPQSASADFCLRLARANAVQQRRLDAALGSHHGISFADFQLLNLLCRAPGGKMRRVDLAERLSLTPSGVTRSLLPLEKIGLVTRQADPRDARVGYAVITPVGQELLLNATDVVDVVSRELTRALQVEQTNEMHAFLGKLAGMP